MQNKTQNTNKTICKKKEGKKQAKLAIYSPPEEADRRKLMKGDSAWKIPKEEFSDSENG